MVVLSGFILNKLACVCGQVYSNFFFSSRRRHTRCALVTGVQTCALPICSRTQLTMSSRKRWWISLARVPPTSPLVFEIVAIPLSLRLSAMVCRSAILENSHSVRLPLFRRHLVFRKIEIGRASCRERVCQYV